MSDENDQGDLFGVEWFPEADEDWTPERVSRFEKMRADWFKFKADHPEVGAELERLAMQLRARGFKRYSLKALFEVLRYHRAIDCRDGEFKLNNNFTAFYARELMARNPELEGFFELREQTSRGASG